MNGILFVVILTIIILIIAWIGNAIADHASDTIRNNNIRKQNASAPQEQELLRNRFNSINK